MNKTKIMFKHALLISVFVLLSACITKNVSTSVAKETQIAVKAETPAHIPPYSSTISTITMGDGGLLSEQSCKPPCLWGMTPGITHETELWEILKSKDSADVCKIWDFTSDGGDRDIICHWDNGTWITIEFASQQGELQSLTFPLSTTIRIDDIIEKYGIPTWVSLQVADRSEYIDVGVTVFYDDITTRLDFLNQDGTVYNLLPEAEPIVVSYMSPEDYREYLSRQETLVPWHGYGEYRKE